MNSYSYVLLHSHKHLPIGVGFKRDKQKEVESI